VTPVVLIRHAETLMTGETPGAEWPLTEKGRKDATALGMDLAGRSTSAIVLTSPESRVPSPESRVPSPESRAQSSRDRRAVPPFGGRGHQGSGQRGEEAVACLSQRAHERRNQIPAL
jgi:hypothetical protein